MTGEIGKVTLSVSRLDCDLEELIGLFLSVDCSQLELVSEVNGSETAVQS
jgi:hypothetical protein